MNTCRGCLSGWTSTRTSADSSLPFLRLLLHSPPRVSFCLSFLISNSLLRPAQSCRLSRCFSAAVLRAWSLEQRQPRTCQKCSLRPPQTRQWGRPGLLCFQALPADGRSGLRTTPLDKQPWAVPARPGLNPPKDNVTPLSPPRADRLKQSDGNKGQRRMCRSWKPCALLCGK